MTGRIEAGVPFHRSDFPPQIGNTVRAARIGCRGKQPDDPVFSDEIARKVKTLDADIVEIDAPVHARMNVGLGDDEKTRLLEECHNLRRYFQKLGTALQNPKLARAHNAERAVEIRLQ